MFFRHISGAILRKSRPISCLSSHLVSTRPKLMASFIPSASTASLRRFSTSPPPQYVPPPPSSPASASASSDVFYENDKDDVPYFIKTDPRYHQMVAPYRLPGDLPPPLEFPQPYPAHKKLLYRLSWMYEVYPVASATTALCGQVFLMLALSKVVPTYFPPEIVSDRLLFGQGLVDSYTTAFPKMLVLDLPLAVVLTKKMYNVPSIRQYVTLLRWSHRPWTRVLLQPVIAILMARNIAALLLLLLLVGFVDPEDVEMDEEDRQQVESFRPDVPLVILATLFAPLMPFVPLTLRPLISRLATTMPRQWLLALSLGVFTFVSTMMTVEKDDRLKALVGGESDAEKMEMVMRQQERQKKLDEYQKAHVENVLAGSKDLAEIREERRRQLREQREKRRAERQAKTSAIDSDKSSSDSEQP